MTQNNLVDTAQINVKAGNGGDGKVSFRRGKYMPKGGPDGGDGGDGGDIIFKTDPNMATLRDFRAKPSYEAENGERGGSNNMHGADGADLIIKVPKGTLIYQTSDNRENVLIGDMVEGGEEILVASGGVGGKGNDRFKSSTNRSPRQFTRGTKGEKKALRLEIKLIADVGLIGFPNAGKSTLINHLTGADAKVAKYPFTTLNPNLGVCDLKNKDRVILADVPGLIAGASEGKGLGDQFLRHIERTRLIVHMIDPFSFDENIDFAEKALKDYEAIRNELKNYGGNLAEKKEIVAINKIDITEVKEALGDIKKVFKSKEIDVLAISAVTGEGMGVLKDKIGQELKEIPERSSFEVHKPTKVYTTSTLPNKRIIFRENVEEKGR